MESVAHYVTTKLVKTITSIVNVSRDVGTPGLVMENVIRYVIMKLAKTIWRL